MPVAAKCSKPVFDHGEKKSSLQKPTFSVFHSFSCAIPLRGKRHWCDHNRWGWGCYPQFWHRWRSDRLRPSREVCARRKFDGLPPRYTKLPEIKFPLIKMAACSLPRISASVFTQPPRPPHSTNPFLYFVFPSFLLPPFSLRVDHA